MHVAWNPSMKRTATNLEVGSWLIVGDISGDVTAYNCKTFELVGKYKAHLPGLHDHAGSLVNQVLLWPSGGIISCGDDGRIVVADYHFWKVKDYCSSERLQTVEIVFQIVTDACNQVDAVEKAEHAAKELLAKHVAEERKVENARRQEKSKVLPELLRQLEETAEQVTMATRAVAHRKITALQRTKLAMQLLGGTASIPTTLQRELQAKIRAEEDTVGVLGPEAADGISEGVSQKGTRGGRGADMLSPRGAIAVTKSAMTGAVEGGNGDGTEMGDDVEKADGKKKVVNDMNDPPVTDVLTSDLEIIACFKNTGWDAGMRGGKGEWITASPNWHTAASNLINLRGVLSREAEKKRRPMVLSTGSPQSCVAVSEKFKVIFAGGKDRVIRVWNPLIQLENVGVDTLKGHEARIIGLVVIDKYGCLVSAATDKTIKLWDLQTFQELSRLVDNYQHRPVDRLASMSYDDTAGRLLTFGNRGRVWHVAPGSITSIDAKE
jgi:WD40 repeat protein